MFETFEINEIIKSFHNEGIHQPQFYYRDSNQNEIDLVFIRKGEIHCVEIKAGTSFPDNADKAFHQLKQTQYVRGRNAIVCTADKLSSRANGTLILPAAGKYRSVYPSKVVYVLNSMMLANGAVLCTRIMNAG